MKLFLLMAALVAGLCLQAAEKNPAADALWEEILKEAKPPVPPAEWNAKPPTQQEMADFKRQAAKLAGQVADKAKKFRETYPDHLRAPEAKIREANFRGQAERLKQAADNHADFANPVPGSKTDFTIRHRKAMETARARRADGMPAFFEEMETQARALLKDFPNQEEPWQMLFVVASNADADRSAKLFDEILAGPAPAAIKEQSAAQKKKTDRLGKPFALKFTAVDGREVDLSKMNGKVVLIDFWATWCGPCIQELPNLKKTYEELHPKGFEIVGVSFDQIKETLLKFTATNEMPWPQYYDGMGWQNKLGREQGVTSIPAMYLVDKQGRLRELDARRDLAARVEKLLAE